MNPKKDWELIQASPFYVFIKSFLLILQIN